MPSRYKTLILLLIVTLAVGTFAFLHSSNDSDALLRFRALFSNRTLYNFQMTLHFFIFPTKKSRAEFKIRCLAA